jgi:hypothetical protein
MPSANEETKIHLFVGFGGSGGKTLAHFAKLASQHREWAKDADERVYFLLCDTDQDELAQSERDIAAAFEPLGCNPMVRHISLADGVQSMEQHISQVFKRASDEGRSRLADHWWVNEDADPFMASFLAAPPTQGAGQCPPVASFLAWNQADAMRRTINDIVQTMKKRTPTGQGSAPVDVTFVSSLAGGTGRGCWPMLGFLVRQALASNGLTCFPQGYFFDQSCFSNVKSSQPGQSHKLVVNSLTGLSEVIMWVRNDEPSATPVLHNLPRLESAADKTQDVLDIQLGSGPKAKGKSPLNHAWAIFNESKSIRLEESPDFYRMVAGCLYTQVATNMSSMEMNEIQHFGSAGSAVCRVEINEIRSYLIDKVISLMCDQLDRGTSDSDEKLVRQVHDYWDLRDVDLFGSDLNNKGDLLSRVAYHLDQKSSPEKLRSSLEAQEVDNGKAQARHLEAGNEGVAAAACLAALGFKASGSKQDVKEVIKGAVTQRVAKDVQDAVAKGGLSLLMLKTLCGGLQKKLDDSAQVLKSAGGGGDTGSLEALVAKYSDREWRSGKPLTRFSDQEIGEIMSVAAKHAIAGNKAAVFEMLAAGCSSAAAAIGVWAQNIDVASTELSSESQALRKDLPDRERALFLVRSTDGEWDMEANEGPPDSERRFFERVLRPALHPDMLDEIVSEVLSGDGSSMQLSQLVADLLQADLFGEAITGSRRADYRRRLSDSMKRVKESISIEDNLLTRHFSLSRVVRGLLDAYQEKLDTLPAGPIRNKLEKRFEYKFGMSLIQRDGSLSVPARDDVLVSMVIDLAKTCDPFFKLKVDRESDDKGDSVRVALPDEKDVFTGSLRDRMKDGVLLRKAELNVAGFEPMLGGNPFMMVAMTQKSATDDHDFTDIHKSETFDNISSMDYWRQEGPLVKFWLEAAECPSGRAFFEGRNGVYGLGYSDPRLVRESRYREKRWRPWAATTSAQEQEAAGQTDAMLYALLGHVGADANDDTVAACERAKAVVAETFGDWSMPLVTRNKRSFVCARCPMHEGPTGISPNKKVWDASDTIGSIGKFEAAFTTEGDAKAWTEAMLCERAIFLAKLERNLGNRYDALLHGLHHYLDDLWKEAKGTPGENAASFMATIERLQNRLEHQLQAVAK